MWQIQSEFLFLLLFKLTKVRKRRVVHNFELLAGTETWDIDP